MFVVKKKKKEKKRNILWLQNLWKHQHMITSVNAENIDYHVTLTAILWYLKNLGRETTL